MDLSPDKLNGLLSRGINVAWRASYACPCVDPASGAAKPQCPVCNGKGRIWAAEVTGTVGLQNLTNQKGFAMFGTWEGGDALLTVGSDAPLYLIRQYDRVRCVDNKNSFSLVVIPGANDKLLGTIDSVSRVFWLSTDGTTIIDGTIPTVNADGSLSWNSGGGPPADTAYSVTGVKFDEFYVYQQLPANRDDGGEALPKKMQLRRFDLFNR